jgi:regulator of sirC expression with transglutaminase-like and TPR domain
MNLDGMLSLLALTPDPPLDVGKMALLLACDEYPSLDVEAYLNELDGMAHEARMPLEGDLAQRVKSLSRYLFHELGLRGNERNYYDARNSYLNEVLDRRIGIPITLSAVTIAVGRRAGLQVFGVGLPGHFIVKASQGGEEILFDPYHSGRRMTLEKCRLMVEQITGLPFEVDAAALRPVTLAAMATRILMNLKGVYLRQGDFPRAARTIERLRQLAPHDLVQRRDLGATLFQAGQTGRAIDHLEAYLTASPHAGDAAEVEHMLNRARAAIARWN